MRRIVNKLPETIGTDMLSLIRCPVSSSNEAAIREIIKQQKMI